MVVGGILVGMVVGCLHFNQITESIGTRFSSLRTDKAVPQLRAKAA